MIKLTDLLEAEKAFTATSKETGNVSVFKTKAARDAAIKAGSHEKRKTDKDDAVDVPTGEKKPNMFSKDAGYDAPDTDKSKKSKPKLDNAYDAKDFESIVSSLKGKVSDKDYSEIKDALESLENLQYDLEDIDRDEDNEEWAMQKDTIDVEVEDLKGLIKQALSKDKKSEPKLPKAMDFYGFNWEAADYIEDELSKSIGIDGTASYNTNDKNNIEFAFGDNDRETSLFIGREGDTYKVSVENPYGDDFGDVEEFDNESDAIEHAKKLAKKYSKELGAKSEKKTSEPKDSSGGRAGNPQVNKATRQKAKELGITPENLGREEYELKMVQAAHEALTDSNFHSEARKLIAIMEDNPELEKNPAMDPNKPGLGEPGYDDWVKTTAWGSKYGDSSDETDELGRAASNEAGWDGKDALDGIAFELKMRGYKDLALKIQSVFDNEKNEGRIKLTDLI